MDWHNRQKWWGTVRNPGKSKWKWKEQARQQWKRRVGIGCTIEENNDTIFNERVPSKNQTLFVLTLYHTTNLLLIQGNQKLQWVDTEFPILMTVLNYKKENDSSIIDSYNKTLDCQLPYLNTSIETQNTANKDDETESIESDTIMNNPVEIHHQQQQQEQQSLRLVNNKH